MYRGLGWGQLLSASPEVVECLHIVPRSVSQRLSTFIPMIAGYIRFGEPMYALPSAM
jgi:hypothetical protein